MGDSGEMSDTKKVGFYKKMQKEIETLRDQLVALEFERDIAAAEAVVEDMREIANPIGRWDSSGAKARALESIAIESLKTYDAATKRLAQHREESDG